VLSLAAIAAAGCGSSSSSKSSAASTPAAPSTPATPSTPSTGSTPTTAGKVTASTPISDPAARALLIQASAARVGSHLTHPQLTQLVDCTIKKFQAAGIQTVGQLGGRRNQAAGYSSQCLKELNIKPK
jgi:type V secretory pathway adhesin AidA